MPANHMSYLSKLVWKSSKLGNLWKAKPCAFNRESEGLDTVNIERSLCIQI